MPSPVRARRWDYFGGALASGCSLRRAQEIGRVRPGRCHGALTELEDVRGYPSSELTRMAPRRRPQLRQLVAFARLQFARTPQRAYLISMHAVYAVAHCLHFRPAPMFGSGLFLASVPVLLIGSALAAGLRSNRARG